MHRSCAMGGHPSRHGVPHGRQCMRVGADEAATLFAQLNFAPITRLLQGIARALTGEFGEAGSYLSAAVGNGGECSVLDVRACT